MKMSPDERQRRRQLGTLLLHARLAANLTGREAARRAMISQSKVSKTENGRLIKVVDIFRLTVVYDVSPESCHSMVALALMIARDVEERRALSRPPRELPQVVSGATVSRPV